MHPESVRVPRGDRGWWPASGLWGAGRSTTRPWNLPPGHGPPRISSPPDPADTGRAMPALTESSATCTASSKSPPTPLCHCHQHHAWADSTLDSPAMEELVVVVGGGLRVRCGGGVVMHMRHKLILAKQVKAGITLPMGRVMASTATCRQHRHSSTAHVYISTAMECACSQTSPPLPCSHSVPRKFQGLVRVTHWLTAPHCSSVCSHQVCCVLQEGPHRQTQTFQPMHGHSCARQERYFVNDSKQFQRKQVRE